MSTKLDIELHVDVKGDVNKVRNDTGLWTYVATEWWKLITPYTPMDTGALFESVHIQPKEIEYYQPYAHRVYEGRAYNFRTDYHQLASYHWDVAAFPQQKDKLISAAQDYVDNKFNI